MVNPTPAVQWRYLGALTPDDYRCDRCGAVADKAHFVSASGRYPGAPRMADDDVHVVFSCPEHDAGGYGFELRRWWADGMREHVTESKRWGWAAAAAFHDREEEIRRAKA